MFRAPMSAPATSFYKRSNFVTHLPVDCLYSPSHFWIARTGGSRLRVGFTKFATRMLGEIVEVRFEKNAGDAVAGGDIVGSIEGFKAISDIYSCARGTFAGSNPSAAADVGAVGKDPYGTGWLYEVDGEPDDKCVPLDEYRAILDTTQCSSRTSLFVAGDLQTGQIDFSHAHARSVDLNAFQFAAFVTRQLGPTFGSAFNRKRLDRKSTRLNSSHRT